MPPPWPNQRARVQFGRSVNVIGLPLLSHHVACILDKKSRAFAKMKRVTKGVDL